MAWAIEYTDAALRQLRKLDPSSARRIYLYLDERAARLDGARSLGKALQGPMGELWRYRVGDYRVIVELQHNAMTVLVLRVGHRREVYKQRQ